jgi:protease-4
MNSDYNPQSYQADESAPTPLRGTYAGTQGASAPPSLPPKRSSFMSGCLTAMLGFFAFFCLLVLLIFMLGKGCVKLVGELAESGSGFPGTFSESEERVSKRYVERISAASNQEIALIEVKGVIVFDNVQRYASARRIGRELRAARKDAAVKAIILDMDSPGGEVVASDEIRHQVLACREAGKPVLVCMRSLGASGGYFIASAADWIVANRLTFTGSIGVIISSYQIQGLLEKIGVQPEVYRSGDMKDMLNPSRPRSAAEREYVQGMVQSSFREFCQVVAEGRSAYEDADAVAQARFADGRILSGQDALQLGLVDQLGYFEDALLKARELAEAPEASLVRFSSTPSFMDFIFSMQQRMPLSLQSLMPQNHFSPEPGKLYYISPELCY